MKQEPKKSEAETQTANKCEIGMSDSVADMLVENESLKRKLKKADKKIEYHKNKESKFLFFLFTLQNKGIPVNEIYEQDGIKDIPT